LERQKGEGIFNGSGSATGGSIRTDAGSSSGGSGNTGGRIGREFLMFVPAGAGLSVRMQPKGYLKIDIMGGSGRYEAYIQNIERVAADGSNIIYNLYFASIPPNRPDEGKIISAGEFTFSNAGLLKGGEFQTADFLGSGINAADLNLILTTQRNLTVSGSPVVCLAAIRGKAYPSWRDDAVAAFALYSSSNQNNAVKPDISAKPGMSPKPGMSSKPGMSGTAQHPDMAGPKAWEGDSEAPEAPEAHEAHSAHDSAIGPEDPYYQENQNVQGNQNGQYDHCDQNDQDDPENGIKSNAAWVRIAGGDGRFAPGSAADAGFAPPSAESLVSSRDAENGRGGPKSATEKLLDSLDNNFRRTNPFRIRRRDYRWWKIDNPANLNNILYENGIRISLLFNPDLVMSHYKYHYLLIGMYSDRMKRKDYLICGIPAEWKPEDKPFGEYGRWVHPDSSRVRIGSLGYWLIYVDVETGKYLSFS